MILIALGSNLPSVAGTPLATCKAALRALPARAVGVLRTSKWYETAPVPASDQPWFVNGVALVECRLNPSDFLAALQDVENEFKRERSAPNAARTLDLDVLDFNGQIMTSGPVVLPHPRLHERAFVLHPLHDVAPDWRHPVLGKTAWELLAELPQPLDNKRIYAIPAAP